MKTINSILFILFLNSAFSQIACDSITNEFTGICTTSYSDGVLKSATEYLNGVKHGEYRESYHFGTNAASGNFANGEFIGKFERFSPSGSVIIAAEIDENGNGTMTEFNFTGAVMTYGKFQNWRKFGVWTNYNYKGDVLKETNYADSVSEDVTFVLIEEYGFGNEPKGVIDFPTFETEFVGGPEAMQKFIQANVQYPREALKKKISGRVYVSFIVNADGSISEAKIVRGVDPILDNEALRIVNSMPLWEPAVQGGMQVRARARLPISFTISR